MISDVAMDIVDVVKRAGYPVTLDTGVEVDNLLMEGIKTDKCPEALKIAVMHAGASVLLSGPVQAPERRPDQLSWSDQQADFLKSLGIPGMENVLHGTTK